MKLPTCCAHSVLPFAMLVSLSAGCGEKGPPATDTGQTSTPPASTNSDALDPHDVPLTDAEKDQLRQETATYSAAIDRVRSFRDTIRQETARGAPENAHRALDKLDLVLERLSEVAAASGVPKEQWETVTVTAQQLRDSFDQIHADIDAGKAPDYESVASEIDQGIETLAAIRPEVSSDARQEVAP